MSSTPSPHTANVVGSGPNGLAAAITLARAGVAVRVFEAAPVPGGGMRSAALTEPGFVHDVCATVVATALLSPFFATLDLPALGVELAHPAVPLGHALDDGAVILHRDVRRTADGLGRDGPAYRRLIGPLVRDAARGRLLPAILGPVLRIPRHPLAMARFGLPALASSTALGRLVFREPPARALLAGLSTHAMVPLGQPVTASFGLVLAMSAHLVGWPVVKGGTAHLAEAMVRVVRSLGGAVLTDSPIRSLDDLPPAEATLLDVTPRQLVSIAGQRLPAGYRRALERFRYGPGVCKVDWALDGPIPWRASELAGAGTVHLGGPVEEVELSEREVHGGRVAERPFVILVQATVADPSRAPAGSHTAWAYAHVPHGSDTDIGDRIEAQVERFAPGFRDRIVGRAVRTASELEAYDANYVGGDINSGLQDLPQLLARPVLRWDPYWTSVRGLYLCSSSTPPGGGIHGMSGYLAARSAMRREFGLRQAG